MPTEFQVAISKYLSLRASIEGVCRLATPEEKPNKSLTTALAAPASPKVDPQPPRKTRKGDRSPSRKLNRKNRERKYKEHACVFCSEQHYSGECPSVITLSARKAALKDKCILCLSLKHTQPSCLRTYVCCICNQKNEHGKALCPIFACDL